MQKQSSRKALHRCRIRVEILKCTTGQVGAPRAAITQPAWTHGALGLAVHAADGDDFRLDPAFRLHRPVSGQGWLQKQQRQNPGEPIPAGYAGEMPAVWWEASLWWGWRGDLVRHYSSSWISRGEMWSGHDHVQSSHKFPATFAGWMKAVRKSLARCGHQVPPPVMTCPRLQVKKWRVWWTICIPQGKCSE